MAGQRYIVPVFNRLAAAARLGSTRRLRFNPCDAELFYLLYALFLFLFFSCFFQPEKTEKYLFSALWGILRNAREGFYSHIQTGNWRDSLPVFPIRSQ